MTYEGQGPGPDEIPPPVTTRWSEEPPTSAGDEISPPFVPTRTQASGAAESVPDPSAPPPSPEVAAAVTAPEPGSEGRPDNVETASQEDGFSFDPLDTGVETAAAPGAVPQPTAEVAALLEQMARLLREEGAGAVEREMRSPDRLTSLLAGLVSGYVSGRS